MYNTFQFDRQQKVRLAELGKTQKEEEFKKKHRSKNEKMRDIFEKKLDHVLEYRMDNPFPEFQNFVLNETFHLEKRCFNYKNDTSKLKGTGAFLMTYNRSQNERVQHNVEKHKLLSPEYTPVKPVEFRNRDKEKDIHPPMRFNTPNCRSNSVSLNRTFDSSIKKSPIKPGEVRIKSSVQPRRFITFGGNRNESQCESNFTINTQACSDSTESVEEVEVACVERRSPYKSLQQFANNPKNYILEQAKEVYDKKFNEMCYPPSGKSSPKKVAYMNRRISMMKEHDSSSDHLEYEVESDAGSIDDSMLEGEAKVAKKKKIDKKVLDRQLVHNQVRTAYAKGVLYKANAVKLTTSIIPHSTLVMPTLS